MNPPEDFTNVTDEALLHLVKQNDKQALLLLFDRYAPVLYSTMLPLARDRRFKDAGPEDTAKQILILVFTTLWDERQTVHIQTTVQAYLLSEAYNKFTAYTRILKCARMRRASPRRLH